MIEDFKIILMLDFDGTLSPIVDDPRNAVLPKNIKGQLIKLAKRKDIKVCVITGRSMGDIRRRIGLKKVIYAAYHGMEIFYGGKYLLKMGGAYKKPLKMLAEKMRNTLSNIQGVIVEDKALAVTVHFRMVRVKERNEVKKTVRKLAEPFIGKFGLQLTAGKMILEIRPAKLWNKGKAALWIWHKIAPRHIPVYIGDDVTDEDAFVALRPHGLTIRIGRKRRSHAECYVSSVKSFLDLLT